MRYRGLGVGLLHVAATCLVASSVAHARINEVRFDPGTGQSQLVELYGDAETSVSLEGYILTDSDGNDYEIPAALPLVPTGAFVLVHFDGLGSALNDYDFGDNVTNLHTDPSLVDPFDSQGDEVSLYSSAVFGADTIESFVAWGTAPGLDASDAVEKGLWLSDATVIGVDTVGIEGPNYRLSPGATVGVFPDVDPVTLGNWVGYPPGQTSEGSDNPAPGPALYLPENLIAFENGEIRFSWLPVLSTALYQIQIDDDPAFGTPFIDDDELAGPHYVPGSPLPDGTYHWRVRAFDSGNVAGAWSDSRELSVGYPPSAVMLKSPIFRPRAHVPGATDISGTISDSVSGNGLAGVAVVLFDDGGGAVSATTDFNGNYSILAAPDGDYILTLTLGNYDAVTGPVVVGGGVMTINSGMLGQTATLDVPVLAARKDGALLCIDGEQELATTVVSGEANHAWDASHVARAHFGPHEMMYCTPTAAAMLARYFGNGTVTIEEIDYQLHTGGGPEGDLGHGRGAGHRAPQIQLSLTYALQTSVGNLNFTAVRPTDAELKAYIDAGRPIRYSSGPHAMVVDGYRYVDKRAQGRFLNTDNDGGVQWFFWSGAGSNSFASAYIPNLGLVGRTSDPRVATDTDADGVMDYDEDERFDSARDVADTDRDQVNDKNDIRNYTFHRFYHDMHRGRLPASLYDMDGDGRMSENDCDSDGRDGVYGNGDFDGGEDINGNGHNPDSGETCMFDVTSWEVSVSVDKSAYLVGEKVRIIDSHGLRETHTYHANSTYNYEQKPGCPTKLDGSALTHSGSFTTDAGGHAHTTVVQTCPSPGEHYLTVDVLDDLLYSVPDNTDPQTCWRCMAVTSQWELNGTAQGGEIIFGVNNVPTYIITTAGQTSEQLAELVAEAVNDNSTLQALGIIAAPSFSSVQTNGTITSVEINDAGLYPGFPPASAPALGRLGLTLFILLLAALGLWALRKTQV